MPAQIAGRDAVADRFERRLVDRARCVGRAAFVDKRQQRRDGEDHRHRVGDVLPEQARCGPVRCFGHHDVGLHVGAKGHQRRFRTGDRAEQLHDEVREAVAVAIERRDDQRIAGG